MEFRCFVCQRTLLCVSQRDSHYYPFLAELVPSIQRFARELFDQISDFPSENWVFDMYIPRTRLRGYLIDINPFAPRTDPGQFTWEEILRMTPGEGELLIRLVGEQGMALGGIEFSGQRVPLEVVEASQGKGVVEFAVQWEEMLRRGVSDATDIL